MISKGINDLVNDHVEAVSNLKRGGVDSISQFDALDLANRSDWRDFDVPKLRNIFILCLQEERRNRANSSEDNF